MFYKDLYNVLGKLFYYTASVDGRIHTAEKKALHELVQKNWMPIEKSTDEFGTDLSNQIEFSFDYEETEGILDNGLKTFENFYFQNKEMFTSSVKKNILETVDVIGESFRGKNRYEKEVGDTLKSLFSQ